MATANRDELTQAPRLRRTLGDGTPAVGLLAQPRIGRRRGVRSDRGGLAAGRPAALTGRACRALLHGSHRQHDAGRPVIRILRNEESPYDLALGSSARGVITHGVAVGILIADLAEGRARLPDRMRLPAAGRDTSSLAAEDSSPSEWKVRKWK